MTKLISELKVEHTAVRNKSCWSKCGRNLSCLEKMCKKNKFTSVSWWRLKTAIFQHLVNSSYHGSELYRNFYFEIFLTITRHWVRNNLQAPASAVMDNFRKCAEGMRNSKFHNKLVFWVSASGESDNYKR